ncbi:MAG: antirestriction protein ArdA [Dialister invisus]|uniref:antirestriction protein ArdA n=1 Tax=Dialister invisus TaxID=218538 RepID=UPI003991B7F0
MKLIDLLREGTIRTWHNHNFLVHMQFTDENYIADTIEEAIQVANMTKEQQETLSAYLDVFKEVKDKTIIVDIFNDCMFLTSSHNMTEYAKKWCAVYIRNDVYNSVKNYIDYRSLGASFYADGCYIKTPKGIIERLPNVPTKTI